MAVLPLLISHRCWPPCGSVVVAFHNTPHPPHLPQHSASEQLSSSTTQSKWRLKYASISQIPWQWTSITEIVHHAQQGMCCLREHFPLHKFTHLIAFIPLCLFDVNGKQIANIPVYNQAYTRFGWHSWKPAMVSHHTYQTGNTLQSVNFLTD